jgi:hypothetical protein
MGCTRLSTTNAGNPETDMKVRKDIAKKRRLPQPVTSAHDLPRSK